MTLNLIYIDDDMTSRSSFTSGNDGCPKGERGLQIFSACHGCQEGDVKVEGAGGGGDEDLLEHPHQTPSARRHGLR